MILGNGDKLLCTDYVMKDNVDVRQAYRHTEGKQVTCQSVIIIHAAHREGRFCSDRDYKLLRTILRALAR